MSVRERVCGGPRGDGCGKPIGNAPYAVRYDEELKQSIVYHLECEAKLPPLELWTTVPTSIVSARIADEIMQKAWEELVESAFARHGAAIKEKNKKLLEKYPDVTDEELKETAKRARRR